MSPTRAVYRDGLIPLFYNIWVNRIPNPCTCIWAYRHGLYRGPANEPYQLKIIYPLCPLAKAHTQ